MAEQLELFTEVDQAVLDDTVRLTDYWEEKGWARRLWPTKDPLRWFLRKNATSVIEAGGLVQVNRIFFVRVKKFEALMAQRFGVATTTSGSTQLELDI